MNIGDQLKQLRIERGLSQSQLARKLGTSQGQISAWEKGALNPGTKTLLRYQEYFNTSLIAFNEQQRKRVLIDERTRLYAEKERVDKRIADIDSMLDSSYPPYPSGGIDERGATYFDPVVTITKSSPPSLLSFLVQAQTKLSKTNY